MVQGQWLLLVLMACSPESLRIHVPKRGVESVQQEDLRRAIWAMQSREPTEWFRARSMSLGLDEPNQFECYSHIGRSTHRGTRLMVPDVNPVSIAVMASLAKSLHGVENTKSGWQFCLGYPTESIEGWQDVSLSLWIDVSEQSFMELNFVALEQSIRQVVGSHLLIP